MKTEVKEIIANIYDGAKRVHCRIIIERQQIVILNCWDNQNEVSKFENVKVVFSDIFDYLNNSYPDYSIQFFVCGIAEYYYKTIK